jgi:hypothetical protein
LFLAQGKILVSELLLSSSLTLVSLSIEAHPSLIPPRFNQNQLHQKSYLPHTTSSLHLGARRETDVQVSCLSLNFTFEACISTIESRFQVAPIALFFHTPPTAPLGPSMLGMPPRTGLTSSFSVSDANNEVVCPLKNHDGSSCRKRCLGVSYTIASMSSSKPFNAIRETYWRARRVVKHDSNI